MKLPVLKVNALPNLYKHCSTVYVLHIDLPPQSDDSFMQSYWEYIRAQMYQIIESNFVTAQATRVYAEHEECIVFKSNIEQKQLAEFLEYLMAEVDEYLDSIPEQAYRFVKAMIFEKGAQVKLFSANKVGDDLFDSMAYDHSVYTYRHQRKSRSKQLCSPQEYRPIYERQMKKRKEVKTVVKEKQSEPQENGYIEYYI